MILTAADARHVAGICLERGIHRLVPGEAVLLRELAADGLSVLLVEHDMPFVMGLSERVSMLDHGVIVVTGTPAEVQANPDVQAAYLGSREAVS